MTVDDTHRDTFAEDWTRWRRDHEAQALADPHGFLAITGLHWLTAEPERFDDAPGTWSASADGVTVTLDDGEELIVRRHSRPRHLSLRPHRGTRQRQRPVR